MKQAEKHQALFAQKKKSICNNKKKYSNVFYDLKGAGLLEDDSEDSEKEEKFAFDDEEGLFEHKVEKHKK